MISNNTLLHTENVTEYKKILSRNNICYKIVKNNEVIILTAREAECLYYTFNGRTAKHIAKLLKISNRTVEVYLKNLRSKLDCNKKNELFTIIDAICFCQFFKSN